MGYSIRNYHATGSYPGIHQTSEISLISATVGNMYYFSVYQKSVTRGPKNSYIHVGYYEDGTNTWLTSKPQTKFNIWEKSSIVQTMPSSTSPKLRIFIAGYSTSSSDGLQDIFADGIMAIDLTAQGQAFQTQAWLDKNVPFFEGTGSVKSDTVNAGGTVTFNLTPAGGKFYTELVCDGGYREASVNLNTNVLTVTGVSSDIQCPVFYE